MPPEVASEEASALGEEEQDGWGRGGYHREMEPHFLDDWVEGLLSQHRVPA